MQQMEFFDALERGELKAVQSWLSRGMSVNEVQNYGFDQGRTPLIVAAGQGNAKLVRLLLQRGAQVDQRNIRREDFPLLQAVKESSGNGVSDFYEIDYPATVKLLLQAGANPNQGDVSGDRPLYFAGSTAVMAQLLNAGAKPNAPTTRPPLIEHAGHADRVALLLKAGANPDVRDAGGKTALHRAATEGALESVQLLLKAMSSDAIQTQSSDERTALDAAAWQGNVQIVQALLAKGLRPTQITWESALQQGRLQAARVIRDSHGGEPWPATASSTDLSVPVYAAIVQGQPELARSLYQQSQDKSCGDDTLLMHAVNLRNEEAVRALLALKIDVNYQAQAPLSAEPYVHPMSSSGRPVMRYELPPPCAAGGKRSVRRLGTALRVAVENTDLRMTQLLVQGGADPALRSFYKPNESPQSLWQAHEALLRRDQEGRKNSQPIKDAAAWRQLLKLTP